MNVNEKISSLRKLMKTKGIDAYMIPSNDPHMSEYPPKHWESRKWLSGFTGSLGTVIITKDSAGLWVDSRYFLQGEKQIKGTEFILQKQKSVGSPDHYEWLLENMPKNSTVGIDGSILPFGHYNSFIPLFEKKGIKFTINEDLISEIWKEDRPDKPLTEFFIHDEKFAGESAKNKIERLRSYLKDNDLGGIFINGLDEIAWIFNLRAKDVVYNPVGLGYAYIDFNNAILFTYKNKIKNIEKYLSSQGISVEDYDFTLKYISNIKNTKIALDPNKIGIDFYLSIDKSNTIKEVVSPVALMKSVKNISEIDGIIESMKKDGVALTRFFMWLEHNIKNKITEYDAGVKLTEFRKEQKNYFGDSFGSIIGFKGNGAIVHYSAQKESSAVIEPEGMLLVDSGGQYLEGTTDITRTICFGTPTEEQKKTYTLVLKSHINLHCTIFPKGKSGSDLELLARIPLWREGLNFGHGVGHGIGAFLNVHEGPYSFAINEVARKIPLEEGMLLSNEPGFYKIDEFGIRIENIVLVKKSKKTEYGEFLEFEELTLFPINTELVDKKYLSNDDINWLNKYNKKVYTTLSHLLNESEKKWLSDKCKEI